MTGKRAGIMAVRPCFAQDRRPVYRLTRGRHTFASLVSGIPLVMLTTTGARSGQPRTVPVLRLPTTEGLAVIASNFGQQRHPAWYYNLRANREGSVAVEGQSRRFRAAEAEGDRRRRIWEEGLRVYPSWSQYERRAANRRIAVFVLEPTQAVAQPPSPHGTGVTQHVCECCVSCVLSLVTRAAFSALSSGPLARHRGEG